MVYRGHGTASRTGRLDIDESNSHCQRERLPSGYDFRRHMMVRRGNVRSGWRTFRYMSMRNALLDPSSCRTASGLLASPAPSLFGGLGLLRGGRAAAKALAYRVPLVRTETAERIPHGHPRVDLRMPSLRFQFCQ